MDTLEPLDLSLMLSYFREEIDSVIGYPATTNTDFSELVPFFSLLLNNVGDPFAGKSRYLANTLYYERKVVEWFAKLYDMDDPWGYVTGGGSEGNLYGLRLARETLPNAIVYYSQDAHYSVCKAIQLLGMNSVVVGTDASARMLCSDLASALFANRMRPAIVVATVGTTMSGGVDLIAEIRRTLSDALVQGSYVHCDAAMLGMLLPFLGENYARVLYGADSISVSGHKMIGTPLPCGVLVTRKSLADRLRRRVDYIGADDVTLSGSRSGLPPLMLYHAVSKFGMDGFRKRARYCIETAEYASLAINSALPDHLRSYREFNTVTFPLIDGLDSQWQFAVTEKTGKTSAKGHVVVTPSVTREKIDAFAKDLRKVWEAAK